MPINLLVEWHDGKSFLEEAAGRRSARVLKRGNVYDPADGKTPMNWWT